MDHSCCFSLGGNLDFLDFLQKKFYNIDCSSQSFKCSTTVNYDFASKAHAYYRQIPSNYVSIYDSRAFFK